MDDYLDEYFQQKEDEYWDNMFRGVDEFDQAQWELEMERLRESDDGIIMQGLKDYLREECIYIGFEFSPIKILTHPRCKIEIRNLKIMVYIWDEDNGFTISKEIDAAKPKAFEETASAVLQSASKGWQEYTST